MQTILTIIHIIIGILLIITVLLQSGSDELKGLGSSISDNVISPTASANFMTKFTAILAALFIINCLVLSNISSRSSKDNIAEKISRMKPQQQKKVKDLPMAS